MVESLFALLLFSWAPLRSAAEFRFKVVFNMTAYFRVDVQCFLMFLFSFSFSFSSFLQIRYVANKFFLSSFHGSHTKEGTKALMTDKWVGLNPKRAGGGGIRPPPSFFVISPLVDIFSH